MKHGLLGGDSVDVAKGGGDKVKKEEEEEEELIPKCDGRRRMTDLEEGGRANGMELAVMMRNGEGGGGDSGEVPRRSSSPSSEVTVSIEGSPTSAKTTSPAASSSVTPPVRNQSIFDLSQNCDHQRDNTLVIFHPGGGGDVLGGVDSGLCLLGGRDQVLEAESKNCPTKHPITSSPSSSASSSSSSSPANSKKSTTSGGGNRERHHHHRNRRNNDDEGKKDEEEEEDAHAIHVHDDDDDIGLRQITSTTTMTTPSSVSVALRDRGYDCSAASLCGRNPRRIALVVALVMSVWASIILGLHIQKKVSGMEDRMHSMSSKILDLQDMYLRAQDDSTKEIGRLHDRIHKMVATGDLQEPGRPNIRQSKAVSDDPEYLNSVAAESDINGSKMDRKDDEEKAPHPSDSASPLLRPCTVDGLPCIFPFSYKGENRTSCVKEWYRPGKPWCPTRLADDGGFVDDGGNGAWGDCGEPCAAPLGE